MANLSIDLSSLTRDEKKYVLARSYPLFAAYYADMKIAPFHAALANHWSQNRFSLTLLPQQHGKSTTMKWDIIRNICLNPNVRIILTTATKDDADEYVRAIESELTGNQKLIEDFGPFYNPNRWTSSGFRVAGCQHTNPHDTLETFGSGTWNQKGHGCEIVYVDDCVTEETCLTPEARAKQLRWFNMAVVTGPRAMWTIDPRYGLEVPAGIDWPKDAPYNPQPGDKEAAYGQVIVMGTCFDPNDLYDTLRKSSGYKTLYYDCYWDYERDAPDPTQTKALWPEVWPIGRIEKMRDEMGWSQEDFDKRMRNIARSPSEIVFRKEWFYGDDGFHGCIDEERSYGDIPEDVDLYRALGFDPASGKHTVFAAYPTWMLLGMKRDGDPGVDTRYVIDAFRLKSGVEDLLDVLLDGNPSIPHPGFHAKYAYDVCIMEQNGFANLMTTHARMTQAKNRGIIFKPHETQRNKRDPYVGVQSMAEGIKGGLWSFPYKTDEDKRLTDEIVTQFVDFSFTRSGRKRALTDYVMAPLDIRTPLWTTGGWKTMGSVDIGDMVATPCGDVAPVAGISKTHRETVYRVTLDDNTSLRCTADHRWFAHEVTHGSIRREPRWMTTEEMRSLDAKRVMLARPEPIRAPERDLVVDPYVLGVWLGDGDARQGTIFGHDDDTPYIREEFERRGMPTTDQKRKMTFGTTGLRGALDSIGVLRNKHVPEEYLLASVDQRLALLQGLMDTDGTVMNGSGRVYFGNSNGALVYAAYLLINSLGFRANIQEAVASMGSNPNGGLSFTQPFWRVVFTASSATLCPFLMPRKAEKVVAFDNSKRPRNFLTVKAIEPDGEADVCCIAVAHESHQFLAGHYYIPTGNSWFSELELRSLKRERKSFKHKNSPRGWTIQNRRGRASA